MRERLVTIQITAGTIFLTLLFLLGGWFLYEVREVILVVVSAVIFAMALDPMKRFLSRFRIPEQISVVILYVSVFTVFTAFLYSIVPTVLNQYYVFLEALPNISTWMQQVTAGTIFENFVAGQAFFTDATQDGIPDIVQRLFTVTGSGIFSLFGGLVNIILFLLLTFLFAVNQKVVDDFLLVMTPRRYQAYIEDLWCRVKVKVGQWLQGQLLLICIVSVLVYLALTILGIPNALFLAVFAGILEIIPIFGPVLGAIPAILMALTTGDTTLAFLVVVVFIIIQQFENNLIYPLVVAKVVGISSILVILSVVMAGMVAGFVGVVIAVPLAAIVQEVFNDLKSGKIQKLRARSR
ncbi:MAG: AI-2E family transporter [Candidatus Kaiserbacteria bacterium]|nr:AI-2E family transporter [Candidatus Kaiserbacteria bacterium]